MKLYKQFVYSVLTLALLSLGACGGSRAQSQEQTESQPSPERKAASFSADSAYSYVVAQVQMGPRTPGSEAHTRCARWIEDKLRSWGYTVTLQRFEGKDYYGKAAEGTNIIATLQPEGCSAS